MPKPNKYDKLRQEFSSEAVDMAIKLCRKYELKESYRNVNLLSLNLSRYSKSIVESSLELQRKHKLSLDSLQDLNETLYGSDVESLEKIITMMKKLELQKTPGMFYDVCDGYRNHGQQTVEKSLEAVKNYGLPFTPFWFGFLTDLYYLNDARKVDDALMTLRRGFIDLKRNDLMKFFKACGFEVKHD